MIKELPQLTINPKLLFDIQFGAIRAQIMMSAIELKIFNFTTQPATSMEVSAAIGAHAANIELFMNALCSLDLLQKKAGKYQNTLLTETFLVEGKETWLGEFIQLSDNCGFQNWQQMRDVLINGPTAPSDDSGSGESNNINEIFQKQFVPAMRNFARSGAAQAVADELAKLPEFKSLKKMLDFGGAHGLDCIATIQKHPSLRGVILDKPHIIDVTREIISEYGMDNRIEVIGADCITDPIGGGYDLILAKAVLNLIGPALENVLEKIYQALNPGGIFVSIHEGLTEEKTQPAGSIISWLPLVLNSMDVSFEQHLMPKAMENAGFIRIETKPYHFFPMGDKLEIVTGRK